jgi:antibiotic biosynthesis monooxygenase (ABM) superfamily enzyme
MKTIARLKASLKIWIVIYPALTLSLHFFGGPLSTLPLYLRTLVLTLALVPFIVFIGVPGVDRVIHSLSSQSGHGRV